MSDYGYAPTIWRDRRQSMPDPYNPSGPEVVGGWDDTLDSVELEGCYIAPTSTLAIPAAARTESQQLYSLYCRDSGVDIKVGDRVRADGSVYLINRKPMSQINPFTGWDPGIEIILAGTVG